MKSRRSFKLENWMTNTYLSNHGLNGIILHSVGFKFFKKSLTDSIGNLVKYIYTEEARLSLKLDELSFNWSK